MGSAEEAGGRHVDLRRAASAGVLQAEDRAHAAAEALQQHRPDQQQQQPAARALPGWATRLIDYFVVCGLGAEVRTMDGQRGFHGVTARDGDPVLYQPQMTPLDFYPPKEHKKFGVPEGLPMVVMPRGLRFYERGPFSGDKSTQPRSYPMVITDTVGTKVYVAVVAFRDSVEESTHKSPSPHQPLPSHLPPLLRAFPPPPSSPSRPDTVGTKVYVTVVAFRDPVEEDVAEAYGIPRLALRRQPVWDTVQHLVTAVPLPEPGQRSVVFSVEKCLLFCEAPPPATLPAVQLSFHPLVRSLDVDNIILLVTAVLLEKRILLRATQYELLTLVAESVSHLIYPFKWAYPYTPVLPLNKLELVHMPGSFLFGIVPTRWTDHDLPGGVMVVDLDANRIAITTSGYDDDADTIPPLPEPENTQVREALLQLVAPDLMALDQARTRDFSCDLHKFRRPWGRLHDREIRLIFFRFFASILCSYRHFVDKVVEPSGHLKSTFNKASFFRKRAKVTGNTEEPLISQLLHTQCWQQFLDSSSSGGGSTSFFDRVLVELERLDIATGPAMATVDLADDDGAQEIITVPPPTPKGAPPTPKGSTHQASVVPEHSPVCFQSTHLGPAAPSFQTLFPATPLFQLPFHSKPHLLVRSYVCVAERAGGRYTHRAFPSLERSAEEKQRRYEFLQQVRLAADAQHNSEARRVERDAMVGAIKGKFSKLWDQLLALPPDEEPLSSREYGTIYAMMEDEDGVGSSGFMEVLQDKLQSKAWGGELKADLFVAVRELVVLSISRAAMRSDMQSVLAALELAGQVHQRDGAGHKDTVLRHIGALPIWKDFRFWKTYHDTQLEVNPDFEGKVADLVQQLLGGLAQVMAEMGLVDGDAWAMLEVLSSRLSLKRQIVLRGQLALLQRAWQYYPLSPTSPLFTATFARHTHAAPGAAEEGGGEGAGGGGTGGESQLTTALGTAAGRWMSTLGNLNLGTFQKQQQDKLLQGGGGSQRIGVFDSEGGKERPGVTASKSLRHSHAQGRGATGVRVLRGHKQPVTALHAGTRSELGDLLPDSEDGAGYFVSGSCDTSVKLWDPSTRGDELRATMHGHTGAVRCVGSDATRVLSGGDDKRLLVFDKATARMLADLRGHHQSIIALRMLPGLNKGSVVTAGREGQVNLWDTRTDHIASTLFTCPSPHMILALDYLDHAGILVAAGTQGICYVWDVRAGKERFQLEGHTNWVRWVPPDQVSGTWVRAVRVAGDVVVTGSDDWTARVWTLNDGECEATVACHAGPVTAVDYVTASRGFITGSADCTVRLWDRGDGVQPRCVKTLTNHTAPIVAVRASDRYVTMAAEDDSLSLLHRPFADRSSPSLGPLGGPGSMSNGARGYVGSVGVMTDWQLARHLNRAPDLIRHAACDVDRGRICTGARSGVLRVWEPPTPLA
ncbi:unnamed protein product [Closterium sp. Yama58-4]|nr:unnamed protein product [Closterium sp. Yama58-4]